MDSYSYGYRGEHGPEIVWASKGDYVRPAMDTRTALTAGYLLAVGMSVTDPPDMVNTTADDPDDGCAGALAEV